MRIATVTDKFVSLDNVSGCYMKARWEGQTMRLTYRTSGNLIAEIYDYTNKHNYRLRLHPLTERYGVTSHNNRLWQVLRSIQNDDTRYSTFVHYGLHLYDRKLCVRYSLGKHPIELQFTDGKLVIDYKQLESNAIETPIAPTPVELDTNSNLQTVNDRLTTIIQGA